MKSKLVKDLYSHISYLAAKDPQKPSILRCDKEGKVKELISWKKLKLKIEIFASWLTEEGIKPGDVVSIAMQNSPELLIVNWAAWGIGVITVPLDIKRDTLENHLYKVRLSNAKILITQKEMFTDEQKKKFKKVRVVEVDCLSKTVVKGLIKWKESLSHQALILFTSGTTSRPKGAQLSLKNLVINADSIRQWLKVEKNDRFMVNLPLHHINSTTFCMATLLAGGSIAVIPNYSNSKFWQQAAVTSSTFTSIVPSICFDQLSRTKEFEKVKDQLEMNRIQIGSAPVVASDVEMFVKLFNIPLYQGYGQTETALRVAGVPLNVDKKTYDELIRTNSIGKAMGWADVQIMDKDGNFLGENKEGELVVKGPAIMKGYLGKINAFRDGYFLTGDIGYFKVINSEKYFFLKGRKKEIIIKGGINISPVAVENSLKKISEDIDQVYVIGVSDRRYGEDVGAVISWKDVDINMAKTRLKYTLLRGSDKISAYETPQFIASIDAKDLPLTSTGKVQRSVLKERIAVDSFEPINLINATSFYKFIKLSINSSYIKQSFDLHNYCWDPLILSFDNFKRSLRSQEMIIAVNKDDRVEGLVSFVRSNLSEKELCLTDYHKLTSALDKEIRGSNGKKIICVSICSSNYRKQKVPAYKSKVTPEGIMKYLLSREDGVYNFHRQPKGEAKEGAKLVCLIPNGRKEDESSLGYNMLLKYPFINKDIKITTNSSVAFQLIEVVMFLARQLDLKEVYAFSRPAGLAKYLAQTKTQ